jgi:hypothetical protein
MLTSIDPGTLRGDLAERLLRLELQRITGSGRRTEAQLLATFEGLRPALLGSLLDLLAQVLAALPAVEVVDPPRMADFAYVVAALDEVLGTRTLDVYRTRTHQTVADVIESDPVAATLGRVLEAKRRWEGTPDALLALLKNSLGQETPRGWHRKAGVAIYARRNRPRKLGWKSDLRGCGRGHGPGGRVRRHPPERLEGMARSGRCACPAFRRFGPPTSSSAIPAGEQTSSTRPRAGELERLPGVGSCARVA